MRSIARDKYFILSLLILTCVVWYFLAKEGPFKDLAMNLGSGFVGTLVTIFFIDRINEDNNEKERGRYVKIAFNIIHIEIQRHYNLLFDIGKASSTLKRVIESNEPRMVFTDQYFSDVVSFDFTKIAPVTPECEWVDYMYDSMTNSVASFRRVSDTYSIHLGSMLTEQIEEFVNSDFYTFLPVIRYFINHQRSKGISEGVPQFTEEATLEYLKLHVKNFLTILEQHNSVLPHLRVEYHDDQWRSDVSPKIGSARIQP